MEILNVILMVISIAVEIIVAAILNRQSKKIASLSRSVSLDLKMQLHELLQTLDIIQYKRILKISKVDHELEFINRFLCNPNSKIVVERLNTKGDKGFWLMLNLAGVLDNPDRRRIKDASDILLSLNDDDFSAMDKELQKLDGNFADWYLHKTSFNDMIRESANKESEDIEKEDDMIEQFFIWLYEEKHIKDPDVALFYAVFKNDVDLVRKALADGADRTVTDKMLIKKYQTEWDEFVKNYNIR